METSSIKLIYKQFDAIREITQYGVNSKITDVFRSECFHEFVYHYDFMLTTMNLCFDGRNKEETLSFWTGIRLKQTGSNFISCC